MEIEVVLDGEVRSANYLVLADETADLVALVLKLRELSAVNRAATITLLVRAKPAARSLTWTEGESIATARRLATETSRRLARAGIWVDEALVGDASPVQAIADVLDHRGPFHAIIISTEPRRISRWLKLDVQTIARKRFPLPIISGAAPAGRLAAA